MLDDGSALPYDLFLGIPVHRVPAVVEASGLAEDGWIPVDPRTLATRFPGVYAVGDVTSVGTPKAGVFAERQASVVADQLIARIRDAGAPPGYDGTGTCYIEFGGDEVARVDVDFYSTPGKPTGDVRRAVGGDGRGEGGLRVEPPGPVVRRLDLQSARVTEPVYRVYVIELDDSLRKGTEKPARLRRLLGEDPGGAVRAAPSAASARRVTSAITACACGHGCTRSYPAATSRPEAEALERHVADRLRRRGFTVYGGH